MTTQSARDTQPHDDEIEHYRARVAVIPDLRTAFLHHVIGPSGSSPFVSDREQHIARFVADALLSALTNPDNRFSQPVLDAIHAERRRRLSAATREGRRG